MPELPWFKFIIAHWMLDRNLAKCSSATRGVWLELIIAMHQDGRSGELRETVDHLAQLARTSTAIMTLALTELQTTGTADVTFRNTTVTVVNRKMKREYKERTSTNLRVKKHRSNKNVTGDETVQSKEVRGKNKELIRKGDGEELKRPRPHDPEELTEMEINATVEFIAHLRLGLLTGGRVVDFWGAFRLNLTEHEMYNSRSHKLQHFRNWLKKQDLSEKEVPKTESTSTRNIIENKTNAILNQFDKR